MGVAAAPAAAANARPRKEKPALKQATFSASGTFAPLVRKERGPAGGPEGVQLAEATEEAGSSGQGQDGGHPGAMVGPNRAAVAGEAGDAGAQPATTSGRVEGVLSRLGRAAAGLVGLGRNPQLAGDQAEPAAEPAAERAAKRPRVGVEGDEEPGEGGGGGAGGTRGPYLCGACAWHLSKAEYKPHKGACPAARYGPVPQKLKGRKFNAKQYLQSKQVEIPPPPTSS